MSVDLALYRLGSSRSHAPPRPIPHSRFSLCLSDDEGAISGKGKRELCRRFVRTQGGQHFGGREQRAREGRPRQENSENVGFHKGTITIVKAEEGARQRASVGYLGGPTAKFSPPLLEYIIPPPPPFA